MKIASAIVILFVFSIALVSCEQEPVDTIWYSPDIPGAGDEIEFRAPKVDNDPEYEWYFDDGGINGARDNVMTHTYTYSGIYHVKVVITDRASNSTEYSVNVEVH